MSPVCPATGHVVLHLQGPRCADHGVPWFDDCPSCGAMWPLLYPMVDEFAASELFPQEAEIARNFCANCGKPGPWVLRDDLMDWLTHQVQADASVSDANRLELRAVLTRLKAMDPEDTKAASAWKRFQELAPKVWKDTKPVRDVLIAEAVKKAMGLLGL